MLAQGDDIVPDPRDQARERTSRRTRRPPTIELTPDDLARLDAELPPGTTAGPRYSEAAMKALNK